MFPVLQDRLKEARLLSGLSSGQLSLLCGFPRQYEALIESGARSEVGPKKLVPLAIVLGLSLDWLLRNIGKRPTKESVRAAVARAQLNPDATKKAITDALGTELASTRALEARAS